MNSVPGKEGPRSLQKSRDQSYSAERERAQVRVIETSMQLRRFGTPTGDCEGSYEVLDR
jgi:hypothetical protein